MLQGHNSQEQIRTLQNGKWGTIVQLYFYPQIRTLGQ